MAFFDLPLDKLQSYQSSSICPDDFDAFWARTLKDHASHDPAVKLTPFEPDTLKTIQAFDVTYAGFDGQPIKGWFIKPANAQGPLPCIVIYHGYGGGRGLPIDVYNNWPTQIGMASFVMDTRGQGGGETGDPTGSAGPTTSGYMTRGIESPDNYYYRRVYTDAVMAIRAAASLADVDPKRIGVTGGSQGGGISIAAAALTPHPIQIVMPDVPFLCDFPRATSILDSMPYAEISRFLGQQRSRIDQTFKTLSYFDGVHLAPRIKARALFSVGLMDNICPPSTVYAAYNQVKSDKEMRIYHYNNHEGGGVVQLLERMRFAVKHL